MLKPSVAFLVFFTIFVPEIVQAKRLALVIGNSAYQSVPPLENPKNDANDMSDALGSLGFEVIKGIDLGKSEMDRIIRLFAQKIPGAKVALFFYAGHGLQVGGHNYLVPADATADSAAALDFEMVRLDLVQRTMERETATNIIMLDACRDNPLARNLARALGTRSSQIGRGLAPAESGEGTLISFSTQPGNVALDGTGRNSPYTSALLRHINAPGDDIFALLINVRNSVMQATGKRQVPWEHSALTTRFFFSDAQPTPDHGHVNAPPNQAPVNEKPSPVVAPSAPRVAALKELDGVWIIERTGSGCREGYWRQLEILIQDGRVGGKGTVTPSGSFRFEGVSGATGRPVIYTGELRPSGGQGKFATVGGNCAGTFVLKRKRPSGKAG